MEKTIEEQKQMVYETLLESKKPLMAKKIAYNIFRKYDGHRMSRFAVRDVLWKEMKGEFEYDKYNYTYLLKKKQSNKLKNESSNNKKLKKENLYQNIVNKLNNKKGHETVSDFRNLIKSNFLGVNTGNKKFDELIKLVVKDNKITTVEESFLKEKTHELGLPFDLIIKAKEHINSNNPYLDNIIHLVFEDGVISENELIFLKEKEQENNFSKSFVNQRFWQIGICYYLQELIKNNQFFNYIKLWEVARSLGLELFNSDIWLIINLDIHNSNNIQEIIEQGILNLENKLKQFITTESDFYDKFKLSDFSLELDFYTDKIELVDDEKNNYGKIIKIIEQEKMRIGDLASDLLAENILFRIENKEWD